MKLLKQWQCCTAALCVCRVLVEDCMFLPGQQQFRLIMCLCTVALCTFYWCRFSLLSSITNRWSYGFIKVFKYTTTVSCYAPFDVIYGYTSVAQLWATECPTYWLFNSSYRYCMHAYCNTLQHLLFVALQKIKINK
jgi:hypothetical protein